MKISLITTVLNEEKQINDFLDSVASQTKLPHELVIVDGGSRDKTLPILKAYKNREQLKLKIIIKKSNRSIGRNYAIKNSRGEIIAVSDVGCTLEKNWIKRITAPFNNHNVDVVSGYYKAQTHSAFQKCLAAYTCVMPDKIKPKNFLPSSRSIAFRKSAWKKVGGYPEELDTCEDLIFDKKLLANGSKFYFEDKALVYWPQRKNIIEAFRQFFSYAVGDGKAFFIRPQTPLLFLRYFLGLILFTIYINSSSINVLVIIIFIIFFYFLWSVRKNYKYVRDTKAFLYLPLLQVTSDIAVILGMTIGLFKRLMR